MIAVLSMSLQLSRLKLCHNILIYLVVKQRVFCGFPKDCIAAVATVDLSCYLNVPGFCACVVGWIVFMCSVFLHWMASEYIMYRTQIACFFHVRSGWAYNVPDTNCVFLSSSQRLGI